MSQSDWKPLFARFTPEGRAELAKLHDGVPSWLRESLWDWLDKRYISSYVRSSSEGYWDPSPAAIRRAERVARIDTQWFGAGRTYTDRCQGRDGLRKVIYGDSQAFLTVLDLALSAMDSSSAGAVQLDSLLREGSSAWAVTPLASSEGCGLAPRLDETVQSAAQAAVERGTQASELLAEAWRSVFSLDPNPTAGYRAAVRAVEAAAAAHVTPADPRPSLGKMIPALRAKPEKWSVALKRDTAVQPVDVIASMMQLLWTNEYSRHVEVGQDVPLHISQAEAEAAVVLSLTLVNWFESGAVTLKS